MRIFWKMCAFYANEMKMHAFYANEMKMRTFSCENARILRKMNAEIAKTSF